MTKRILVGLIAALFFLFIGLVALFNYNKTPNKKEAVILTFVPPQIEFILCLRNSSLTANSFLNNQTVKDCFNFSDLSYHWNQIDSITSRNYKTADVLANNTSFICIDSIMNTLILIDINAKANEHFIDQFIANSASSRKIERFEEGYKAFRADDGNSYYYYVKQNVFGISKDKQLLVSSMMSHPKTDMDTEMANWYSQNTQNISGWGRGGSAQIILNHFDPKNYLLHNWFDSLSTSFTFEIALTDKRFEISGSLKMDTLGEFRSALRGTDELSHFYTINADTAEFFNAYYNFTIKDTLGKEVPYNFVFYSFKDSSRNNIQMLINPSPLSIHLFNSVKSDTSSQIIEMANDKITQITVFNKELIHEFLPINPFNPAYGKLFTASLNGKLFVTNSTEGMLGYAPEFPSNNFIKRRLEKSSIIAYNSVVKANRSYSVKGDFVYNDNQNIINFSTQILLLPNN